MHADERAGPADLAQPLGAEPHVALEHRPHPRPVRREQRVPARAPSRPRADRGTGRRRAPPRPPARAAERPDLRQLRPRRPRRHRRGSPRGRRRSSAPCPPGGGAEKEAPIAGPVQVGERPRPRDASRTGANPRAEAARDRRRRVAARTSVRTSSASSNDGDTANRVAATSAGPVSKRSTRDLSSGGRNCTAGPDRAPEARPMTEDAHDLPRGVRLPRVPRACTPGSALNMTATSLQVLAFSVAVYDTTRSPAWSSIAFAAGLPAAGRRRRGAARRSPTACPRASCCRSARSCGSPRQPCSPPGCSGSAAASRVVAAAALLQPLFSTGQSVARLPAARRRPLRARPLPVHASPR